MSGYLIAKQVHLTAVALTLLLFLARGGWMMTGSAMLARRWVRVLPHIVDTVLLLSALYLAIAVYGYPGNAVPWITAKLVALIAYIALGTVALKRGRTKPVRLAAFLAALAVFAYIVNTALTKAPWPF